MQVWRQEPTIPAIHKVPHPKGYGTSKEKRTKKTWHEVRCDLHGSASKGDWAGRGRHLRVPAPVSRFERQVQGCPICAAAQRRELIAA